MREGLPPGFTLPKVVLEGYDVTMATHVVDDAREERLLRAVSQSFPAGVPEAERARLTAAGAARGHGGRRRRLPDASRFMTPRVRAGRPRDDRRRRAARGREYYAHLVRHFTTLDVTPEEVHEIGRREVARIRAEMEAVIARTGFTGNFAAFLEFLRTDPRFYAKTPEELLKEASFIAKRMDGKLPVALRPAAAPALRRRAGAGPPRAEVHRRPLRRGARRRHAGRERTGSTRTRSTSGRSTRSRR